MSDEPSSHTTSTKQKLATSLLLLLLGGLAGGWSIHELHEKQRTINQGVAQSILPFHEDTDEYDFIRPLLFCRLPESTILGENEDFKKSLQQEIAFMKKMNPELEASVYYRDLNRGRWVGVDEELEYTPASLLKVIILITYFKKAETDPESLLRLITFTDFHAELLARAPLDRGTELVVGQSYTAEDLLTRMIVKSDNGAAYALLANVDTKNLNQVYLDLELKNPDQANGEFAISVREYSYFLRILFNATYLQRDLSERALTLLSQSEFAEGINKGVPSGIPVAHKYGESIKAGGNSVSSLELHDCGIVYHPKNPYLLCIMTRGKELEPLIQTIQNISKKVYEHAAED